MPVHKWDSRVVVRLFNLPRPLLATFRSAHCSFFFFALMVNHLFYLLTIVLSPARITPTCGYKPMTIMSCRKIA